MRTGNPSSPPPCLPSLGTAQSLVILETCINGHLKRGRGLAHGMDLAVRQVLLTSVCLLIVISGHNVYLREPLSEMARSTV